MSIKFIYKCSWFESRRHRKSHTDMFYEHAEHTQWIFTSEEWFKDLVKVEYIQVNANTHIYQMAVETSKIAFWEEKQNQLMKEFEKHRIKECVVCYESVKCANTCKTCNQSMCIKCCYQYHNSNYGKFPMRHEPTDSYGCGIEVLLPCPMCRTENLFKY